MDPDDRRVDAWKGAPGACVLAVMALLVLVALPFALLIGLKEWLLPARPAMAEGLQDDAMPAAQDDDLSPPRLVAEDGRTMPV